MYENKKKNRDIRNGYSPPWRGQMMVCTYFYDIKRVQFYFVNEEKLSLGARETAGAISIRSDKHSSSSRYPMGVRYFNTRLENPLYPEKCAVRTFRVES